MYLDELIAIAEKLRGVKIGDARQDFLEILAALQIRRIVKERKTK